MYLYITVSSQSPDIKTWVCTDSQKRRQTEFGPAPKPNAYRTSFCEEGRAYLRGTALTINGAQPPGGSFLRSCRC